ncbi:MAG TPA: hypothetical protein VGM39_20470 [Kofleriaceae bacterium]|jgi:uncharacterized protein YdcH (DUF465 family)
MRLVLAMLLVAGTSACDRKDPAPSVEEQRKIDDTTYRLEAEANRIADDIEKLDKKIEELEKHAPTTASSAADVQEYKDELAQLTAEKTALMVRIDTLDKAVAAQKGTLGSAASDKDRP